MTYAPRCPWIKHNRKHWTFFSSREYAFDISEWKRGKGIQSCPKLLRLEHPHRTPSFCSNANDYKTIAPAMPQTANGAHHNYLWFRQDSAKNSILSYHNRKFFGWFREGYLFIGHTMHQRHCHIPTMHWLQLSFLSNFIVLQIVWVNFLSIFFFV